MITVCIVCNPVKTSYTYKIVHLLAYSLLKHENGYLNIYFNSCVIVGFVNSKKS